MSYAIEVYFDRETEQKIFALWQHLREANYPCTMLQANYRPHVSLMVSEGIKRAKLESALHEWSSTQSPISLTFSTVTTFPGDGGVVFLKVDASAFLRQWQQSTWENFSHLLEEPRSYYEPNVWVPHCTITERVEIGEREALIAYCQQLPWPRQGLGGAVGIAETTPSSCHLLTSFDFP